MTDQSIKVPCININNIFANFFNQLNHNLGSMRIVLRSIEDKTYDKKIQISGSKHTMKRGLKRQSDYKPLKQKEIIKTFIQDINDFIYFIDALRAIKNMKNDPHVHKIRSKSDIIFEDKIDLLNNYFLEKAKKNNHDKKSFPDKLKDLGVNGKLFDDLKSLNKMRNTFVHHGSIAKSDFLYSKLSISIKEGGVEGGQRNMIIKLSGQKIKVNKGDSIAISEDYIEEMMTMLQFFIFPQIKKLIL